MSGGENYVTGVEAIVSALASCQQLYPSHLGPQANFGLTR